MPTQLSDKTIFSLLEVTKSIQRTLEERYKSTFWVKAEMNKLNHYKQSGHCYPELLEKKDGRVIAQVKSTLWKDDYYRINQQFQQVLKENLKDGIKILFLAKITFDPEHGLSLRIIDIDPSYTLGDLEREKHEAIALLKSEHIFLLNKSISLPLLPQRIAIISVESSKGYADFLKVIDSNAWHYKFFHMLFPSLLQGEKAVDSMIAQLNQIKKVIHHFDIVAIIRGGGGDVGLSCYNHYSLAREIALFPIPVFTGIGHATNETVAEMISHTNAITPTKLAEILLQQFHNFSVPVQHAQDKIIDKSHRIMSDERTRLKTEVKMFRSVTENILLHHHNQLQSNTQTLLQQSTFIFSRQHDQLTALKLMIARSSTAQFITHKVILSQLGSQMAKSSNHAIEMRKSKILQLSQELIDKTKVSIRSNKTNLTNIEKNVNNMSPDNVLKRGYSITFLNGKLVKDVNQLKAGDTINTTIYEGSIESIVQSTNNKTNE
ncbi:MAG TPA: exodeoxyribonuclease VII large subunit [Chitinophagaceae bacterium]|nr:exodeoxyribonuclease VII large subunit [Chitinophagaceae bacterium]